MAYPPRTRISVATAVVRHFRFGFGSPCILAVAILVAAFTVFSGEPTAAQPPQRPPVDFARDVQPLLASKCVRCHGPQTAEAGLRFDSRKAAINKLESGNSAIVPGHPGDSEILKRVTAEPSERMPPEGEPLSPQQVDTIRRWIAAGAGWPEHWAYRPLVLPAPPRFNEPKSEHWIRTPVDRFVLKALHDRGLEPAAEADRRTLLRRVYFDLIGLPPLPDEAEAFLSDKSPDAYEKLVDRLLAMPQYGERWARHWMDVVHYADSHGFEHDLPRNIWPYRDYLVKAFNSDKPYANFVREQVAGDAIEPDNSEALAATGFLAAGPWDQSTLQAGQMDTADYRLAQYLDRDDILSNVMTTFVSCTVHCARCHDHKFDPISQTDYYGLQAVFAGIDKASREYDPDPAIGRKRKALFAQRAEVQRRRDAKDPTLLAPDLQAKALEWQKAQPADPARIPAEVLAIFNTVPQKRNDAQRMRLAAFYLERMVDGDLAALPPQQTIYCGTNLFKAVGSFHPATKPRAVFVLSRGEIDHPRAQAVPGALRCVPGLSSKLEITDAENESQRRVALAGWLADRKNVLTWRSIANRVWEYHFGQGIVDTPNDFGHMGAPPSHPELLDWLAALLRDNGGSIKALHRLIVLSATYRQASTYSAVAAKVDADNRYLWRTNRRRLDAESVRDAVLRLSGKLNLERGGPPVKQFIEVKAGGLRPEADYQHFNIDDPANNRRSIYRFIFRTDPDPFMSALDCPDGSQQMPKRTVSITALQALAMQNDKLVIRQSEHIAAKIESKYQNLGEQVTELYRLVLGREPSANERAAVSEYSKQFGMANACRFLLNTNEFMFVD
jgi:mono/diheme cytochrome c family protein